MKAPPPFMMDTIKDYNFEIKKEIISNKNKKFLLFLKAEDYSELIIKAINSDDFIQKIYTNKFKVEKIKENKYFCQFDDLKEICEEIAERVSKEKISIIEETHSIIISIPLPSSKIK